MIGNRPLCIRFNNIDEFIKNYDGTRYLILFGGEKYDFIHNRIRYLNIIMHKIKVVSFNSLPLEKTLTFHNVIILIKSVFNKVEDNH